jgi:hypothetical protein
MLVCDGACLCHRTPLLKHGVAKQKRADNQSRAIPLTRNDAALSPYGPCERLRTRCGICPKLASSEAHPALTPGPGEVCMNGFGSARQAARASAEVQLTDGKDSTKSGALGARAGSVPFTFQRSQARSGDSEGRHPPGCGAGDRWSSGGLYDEFSGFVRSVCASGLSQA